MHVALIYPPISDPTSGYGSLPYLTGYVRSRSAHRITPIDSNIEALDYLANPDIVADMLKDIEDPQVLSHSCTRRTLDIIAARSLAPEDIRGAIQIMRDRKTFYDYAAYYEAATCLLRWLRLLNTKGEPGLLGNFSLDEDPAINLCNLEHLCTPSVLSHLGGPFTPYLYGSLIPRLQALKPDLVGLSVTYHEQLPFALNFALEFRRQLKGVPIIFGGTDISQVWKYTRQTDAFRHIFSIADACVIGEGETTLVEILDAMEAGSAIDTFDNVTSRRKEEAGIKVGPRYECVSALPPPDYSDLPWDTYFSPERFVYYSPTRGCYWDKCAFCDYGLAVGRPTSPWRERPLAQVLEDLSAISTEIDFVYLSVDVVAPAYLVRLAKGLLERDIRINWGAELRLEKYFKDEHFDLLRRSGCVGLSVGFESASDRILRLMDKGTRIDDTRRLIEGMAKAGIGLQIMGFLGFPSETYEEGMESIRFLEETRSSWVFGGLGQFKLTAGSIVATHPGRFGLRLVEPRAGDDVHCFLNFKEEVCSKSSAQESDLRQKSEALQHSLELPRPFLGGIDTPHTYFYLRKFGSRVLDQLDEVLATNSAPAKLRGRVLRDFEVEAIGLAAEEGTVLQLEDGRILMLTTDLSTLAPYLDGTLTPQEARRKLKASLGVEYLVEEIKLDMMLKSRLLRRAGPRRVSSGRYDLFLPEVIVV